jgi:hypothetical protein
MTAGARAAGLAVTVAAALLAVAGPARGATAAPAAEAPGGPGAMSFFDLGRKDCVGTARNTTSKVWYTVAGGVLSDVYEPTVDNTNVGTLQYIVTDGSSFTDLQTRDMTYTVAADPTGMACTVTATSADHGYQLVTTYVTDPASETVLMQTRLSAAPGSHTNISGLHLYARRGRRPERGREHRRAGHQHRLPGAGRRQHEHGHPGGQPGLRGAHVHGPAGQRTVPVGQRRVRRNTQRWSRHARLGPRLDLV